MNKKELFLNTLKGNIYDKKPVWFMRQAGRFLKSYRALRDKYDFLTMCTTPEIALKVTMQPVEELGVDAIILFSDILIPLMALGAKLSYKDGKAPTVGNINPDNISYVKGDMEALSFVSQTIKLIKKEKPDMPLIGFAAAPFTLGCYLFGAGGDFYKIRSFIYKSPQKFNEITETLTSLTVNYIKLQINAGVDAFQLFDSWAGILPKDIYESFVYPFNKRISNVFDTPSIYYIKNSSHINDIITKLDFNCLSVDWRQDLLHIHSQSKKCVQGNLDNTLLLTDKETLSRKAAEILKQTKNIPHIFNLGHGILPQTNPDIVKYLVDFIRTF